MCVKIIISELFNYTTIKNKFFNLARLAQ